MGNIKEKIFLGSREKYNEKLKILAGKAQPEIWTFRNLKTTDPYRILRNYFQFTYSRLEEENKILVSLDGRYSCMNTGLLTAYDEELVAIFSKSANPSYRLPWYLAGFFSENDKLFQENFPKLPEVANYFENASDLIYDTHLEISSTRKEHIIDDNFDRFLRAGYDNKEMINFMIDSALRKLRKKLLRNFKLALPFYYHNTETGDRKLQLLAPLYFPGAPVRLALVLDKTNRTDGTPYYNAVTVLPVEWAYMNARVIVKPDEEWAKLLDDVDAASDEEDIF